MVRRERSRQSSSLSPEKKKKSGSLHDGLRKNEDPAEQVVVEQSRRTSLKVEVVVIAEGQTALLKITGPNL